MTTGGCGCDCCTGLADRTPVRLQNRPGLSEIAYRVGTYGTFRESMIAGLTRSDRPALAQLKTREPADLSIALIDAWAVVSDVLTFYTERIANENYLGTATERRSVSGLVGLIGYRLGEGVAAGTTLAFTLDTSPGSPTEVPIGIGAKVQTLPGPGELPQTFETVEDLTALAGWNAPLVRQTEPRTPQDGDTSVLLAGAATNVNRGDTLLFVANSPTATTRFVLARVTGVAVDAANQRTQVSFRSSGGALGIATSVKVHVMRRRAALFGYNAASPVLFTTEVKTALGPLLTGDEWAFEELDADAVDLDGLYDGVAVGTPVVFLRSGSTTTLATIDALTETSRTDYGISAKVTRLNLDVSDTALGTFGGPETRETVLLLGAEELPLAEVPVTAPVSGDTVDLARSLVVPEELPRSVLIRGKRARTANGPTAGYLPAHADDPIIGELALVTEVAGADLVLAAPLGSVYDRSSVEVWGNVVAATHGESVVDEVLGSGDASRPFQRFTLRRPPLTLVQAANPAGGESTLRVWVNDVLWQEVPSLFGHGPRDRVFATMTDDEGRTVVLFGDGVSGARPPTGHDNLRATYRAGTGLAGLAAMDQLSLLMTRPLGVKAVRNPLPATGAQDPQVAADAAGNAPRTVLTLDRIVSLRDYEDFAANFAGIGKATATWTWDGVVRGVVLSVAGVGGAEIDETSVLLTDLTTAVLAAGNQRVPLLIRPATVGTFALEASLVLDPASSPEVVTEAARAALLDHFSFARRAFGQLVSLGEVTEVLHAVRGVIGVVITRLHRPGQPAIKNPFLLSRALVPGKPPADEGAEVLTIDPEQLVIGPEVK